MKNMQNAFCLQFSAMEMEELLWCGNDIQFAEFHKAEHLRTCTERWGRPVPSHKQMQNVNNDGVEMMFWQQCTKAQV
jgi:hypothetical protein